MTAYLADNDTEAARAFFPGSKQDQRDLKYWRGMIAKGYSNLRIVTINMATGELTKEVPLAPGPNPDTFITTRTPFES